MKTGAALITLRLTTHRKMREDFRSASLALDSSAAAVRHIGFMNSLETPTIETDVQVMFFDTDCAAVVHNLAYLRFIEIARTLLAEKLGMGLTDMARSGLYPVVVRTEIDYRKLARLGDKLKIDGRLDSFDRLRFWCAFKVHRPADDALLVESRQTLALVQMPQGRPVRLPSDWATRFAHLQTRRER